MPKELKIFLTGLMFYTRIPVGNIPGWTEDMLNKSTRYFPIIGCIVGLVGAAVFYGASFLFPVTVAVGLSIAATIFFTGAFHEDGFADFCDGFGGGYTPERILEIMKDSRIGTYGTLGLVLMIGVKFITLIHIDAAYIPFVLIVGHMFSRVFPMLMIYTSTYARLDATSKTKPIGKADSTPSLIFALFTGGLSLLMLEWQEALVGTTVLLIITFVFRRCTARKIGGYTGDVLGALQQLCEVFFYLTILGYQNWL